MPNSRDKFAIRLLLFRMIPIIVILTYLVFVAIWLEIEEIIPWRDLLIVIFGMLNLILFISYRKVKKLQIDVLKVISSNSTPDTHIGYSLSEIFWGHGTSTYIKLINENPDVSVPFENFKAELFLQQNYRDKSLCVLTSCLGGEVNVYKTTEVALPQAMLIYGFRGCIASILKIPSIDALSFHLSFLVSILRSPSGVTLQALKKNNFLPANYFIYFGDPTVTFPRMYQTDVTKIVEEINEMTKSFGFKAKEYESPL